MKLIMSFTINTTQNIKSKNSKFQKKLQVVNKFIEP